MADSVGVALLIVLDTLEPAERTAFVLHDMFDLPFEEIARIVDRSPAATRQLASRGRRRVRGVGTAVDPEHGARRRVVDAFLAASRDGDFDALLAVLHPDVEVRADALEVHTASERRWSSAPELVPVLRGARAVADTFRGRARGAQRAIIDGAPGAVWAEDGVTRAAFVFQTRGEQVFGIELVMEPARLGELDIEIVERAR